MFAALGEITREIWLARRANRYLRYVVNLSFGFLAPIRMIPILIANPNLTEPQQIQALASTANPNSPEDDLRALAGARLVRTEVTPGGALRIAEWLRTRGPLARSLSAIVDRFKDLVQYPEILMIAAAGNDSDRPRDLLFPPRIPAALEGILGVSATKAASVFANFSNRDDLELPRDDGIAAFGGERVDNGAVYLTDVGLFGLAVRDDFPAYAAGGPVVPNTNGWAQWAGTSFATPVVAGFAAGIWAVNPYADGQSILRRLVSPNTGPRNEILLTQQ